MRFFLVYIFLLAITGNTVIFFKRRFEEMLPLSLMAIMLILYCCSIFGMLKGGYIIVFIFAILFPLFFFVKRNDYRDILSRIITPGFLIFTLLFAFVWILNLNRGFTIWDEVSHWGPMVTNTYRLDQLYIVPESTLLVHKDYPPIITLLETLFCKIAGSYNETYLYRSLQVFSFSLILPVFKKLNFQKSFWSFCRLFAYTALIAVMIAFVECGEAKFYSTIYIDCVIGLLFAHCVMTIYLNRSMSRFELISLSITFSFMLLTKQICLAFVVLTLGILIMDCFVQMNNQLTHTHIDKRKPFKPLVKKCIIALALLIIIPLLFYKSWNVVVNYYGISAQFKVSDINIASFVSIVQKTGGEAFQQETFNNFVAAFINMDVFERSRLSLTYWQFTIIFFVIILALAKFSESVSKSMKNRIISLDIMLLLGSIGYAFAIMLTYIYCFGSYEGLNLACYVRYMSTYIYGLSIIAVMMFVFVSVNRPVREYSYRGCCLSIIVLLVGSVCIRPSLISCFIPAISGQTRNEDQKDDAIIIEQYTEKDASIFFLAQGDKGFNRFSIAYLTSPRTYSTVNSVGKPLYDGDIWTVNLTENDFVDLLKNYDYFYVQIIDDTFIDTYSSLIDMDGEWGEKRIYRIVIQDDDLLLEQLN